MSQLEICLLGRFTVRCEQREVACFQAQKVQELFSYLVLHHDKMHHRDQLADILWGDHEVDDSKKYLRKTLWKLNGELKELDCSLQQNLQVEPQWVSLTMGESCWVDVLEFEKTYTSVRGISSANLSRQQFQDLKKAKDLYRGDLLSGWYWDWCILDRERFREMLLIMIHKLMGFSEANGEYEDGLEFGNEILRYDRAHERTHRRMMRLYDLSGNRSAALRQYERCQEALREELDVEPSVRTRALYQQIAHGEYRAMPGHSSTPANGSSLEETLDRIKQMLDRHIQQQEQLSQQIQVLEEAIRRRY